MSHKEQEDQNTELTHDLSAKQMQENILEKLDQIQINIMERSHCNAVSTIENNYIDSAIAPNTTNINSKSFCNILDPLTQKERVQMYHNKFDYMKGHDFEYFCAELLSIAGYTEVKVTPGSNDFGIDIIAFLNGVKYGIQCKCSSSDIGIKAVQEAFSGAKYYDCHVPVVLTNRYFTKAAQETAAKTNVILWNRDKLISLTEYANLYKESAIDSSELDVSVR